MQISNKLTREDFIRLQEVLLKNYKPNKVIDVFLRYVNNILIGFIVFAFIYLQFESNLKNWTLPVSILVGLLVAAILITLHPSRMRKRLRKAINRTMGDDEFDFIRTVVLEENSIKIKDKHLDIDIPYNEISKVYLISDSVILMVPNNNYVFNDSGFQKENLIKIFKNKGLEVNIIEQ